MLTLIQGNIVNLLDNTIKYGELSIVNGHIFNKKILGPEDKSKTYLIPPFVDAHVHIESSMLPPGQFARLAVRHGTLATVSDPHEIANVLGLAGVEFMLNESKDLPFYFCFGAPSCVPATVFETAGSKIDLDDLKTLFLEHKLSYLAEMMNFPGVINNDPEVIAKINLAKSLSLPVDGHAPGLVGEEAQNYFKNGISTDHECFTFDEAKQKIALGVKILIREGSAAKNFNELIPLAKEHPHRIMFCSDDKHPDELLLGHINELVKRAIKFGIPSLDALRMASLNPKLHYGLAIGMLQEGEPADFLVIDNIEDLNIKEVYHHGNLVSNGEVDYIEVGSSLTPNKFNAKKIYLEDIKIEKPETSKTINYIQVLDGQLITEKHSLRLTYTDDFEAWLLQQGLQKLVVYNRYEESLPAVSFIKGFNLSEGAIASTVAHDSHNIIAVGVTDQDIIDVINRLIEEQGGLIAASKTKLGVLPLPIAGLMSNKPAEKVAESYTKIDNFVKTQLSCPLTSPFMTLSFMALLVIPAYKLSDKGPFDGNKFEFSGIFE